MSVKYIKDEGEAISTANEIAALFATGASYRDSKRALPHDEIKAFSESGLGAITVPREYGGIGVSNETLIKVISIIAAADSSLAQIPQSHFVLLDGLRTIGTDYQKDFFFREVLNGKRIGNAFSEAGGKNVLDISTRLENTEQGLLLTGIKAYATGALYADWVPISALDDDNKLVYAYIPRNAPGLTIIDDWSGIGQRTTASGKVVADKIRVAPENIVRRDKAFATPSFAGPFSQLLHAAIDLGIAKGAFELAVRIVREIARPWIDSGSERADADPHSLNIIGDLQIRLNAAEALVLNAARYLDTHSGTPTAEEVADASIHVAEARVLADDIALTASSRLFELGGTRTALSEKGFDRFWRDARTHTLHDPIRWKRHIIGNKTVTGKTPSLHVWI
ncbi:SfnB family sulfur acquisition oxidoreductase [Tatumella sp. UBA2305]|uniref:SfnB family sulfur acquisition oxidoreductase n=1 Tax=Tatumella sp. UBA2305 TaxID=1947647 RepID=UPI0025E06A41|nr:SfnB family sulfur acquisition oxidoreductase [Tatumella sp. UBA2305]